MNDAMLSPLAPPAHAALKARFAIAWVLPVSVMLAAWQSPWLAWATMAGWQLALALLERVPALRHSPPATVQGAWHRWCIRVHVPLQAGLLATGLWITVTHGLSVAAVVALALGVGGVAGSQGITFAHELGHSRSRLDRVLGWLLMGSVNYAHFMVEHYRGHHPRAATHDDPASARRGESLWRFLPRTLAGGLRSAWRLEAQQLKQLKRGWHRSPLLWATAAQVVWLVVLAALGPLAFARRVNPPPCSPLESTPSRSQRRHAIDIACTVSLFFVKHLTRKGVERDE